MLLPHPPSIFSRTMLQKKRVLNCKNTRIQQPEEHTSAKGNIKSRQSCSNDHEDPEHGEPMVESCGEGDHVDLLLSQSYRVHQVAG
jgi:hypothetical protein